MLSNDDFSKSIYDNQKKRPIKFCNVVFLNGDNFCKAFAGAQVNLSYHEWRSSVKNYIAILYTDFIQSLMVSTPHKFAQI